MTFNQKLYLQTKKIIDMAIKSNCMDGLNEFINQSHEDGALTVEEKNEYLKIIKNL